MEGMFYFSRVVTLDLSSFDISKVSIKGYMFYGCSTTKGYARTQADANSLNDSNTKIPSGLRFVVK